MTTCTLCGEPLPTAASIVPHYRAAHRIISVGRLRGDKLAIGTLTANTIEVGTITADRIRLGRRARITVLLDQPPDGWPSDADVAATIRRDLAERGDRIARFHAEIRDIELSHPGLVP